MRCKIFRNYDTNVIEKVENPQGEPSKLFLEAQKITNNDEDALNIWASAYTKSFKESYGDWNVEPNISDVLLQLSLNDESTLLDIKNTSDLLTLTGETNLSADALYSSLKRLFFNENGQFIIDSKRLVNSGLYSNDEVKIMTEYPSIRGEILQTINKLRNSLRQDDFSLPSLGEEITKSPITIFSGGVNSFGKLEVLDSEEIENYLKENLGNFSSETEFQQVLSGLDNEAIRDAIIGNPEAIDYVKTLIMDSKAVPSLVNRGGVLTQEGQGDLTEILLNTVDVNVSKINFTKALDNARLISEDVWYTKDAEVFEILKQIENEGAKIGIDLSGLRQQYGIKSQEEIVGFLDLIDDFNIKTEDLSVTEDDIIELSYDINTFFDRVENPKFTSINVPSAFKNRNLVLVNENVNETDLYRVEGLVKAFGNVFQRVVPYGSYRDALEGIYNSILKDINIIPKEAFKDFGLVDGYVSVKSITNPNNKSKVIESINNFVSKEVDNLISKDFDEYDINRELALMKIIFNPVKIQTNKVVNNISDRFFKFTGDSNYLMTEYISDFYKKMLEEKVIKASELWNQALRYFTINNKGIDFQSQSPVTQEKVKTLLKTQPEIYEDLSNYALLSKNPNLEFLHEFGSEEIMDSIDTRRDYVVNYPESIEKFKGLYEKLTDNSILVKNSIDEFIKLNDGIYELSNMNDGVSLYSKIQMVTNPNYFVFYASTPIIEDVDLNSFKDVSELKDTENLFPDSNRKVDDMIDNLSCTI